MTGFTALALFILIFAYGIWQYRKLIKWKRELQRKEEHNQDLTEGLLAWHQSSTAWDRDLSHRERVWKDFKQHIEKELKWDWK